MKNGGSRSPATAASSGRASRFAWLFAPTASPSGPPGSEEDARAACDFAYDNWRVLPAVLPRLEQWLGTRNAEALIEPARQRTVAARALARLEGICQRQLSDELQRRNVPHVFLKSSALRWIAYDDPHSRCGWDIDVGVPRHSIERAREIAHALGYRHAEGYVDPPWFRPGDPERRAAMERDHYELGFLVRRIRVRDLDRESEEAIRAHVAAGGRTSWHLTGDGDLACYIIIDVHHGISPEILVEPILATSRALSVGRMTLRVPRLGWLLMHLVYKIYWEGVHDYGKGGYQYADVCRLIALLDDEDLSLFRQIAARWRLEAAAWFVLRRLESEFAVPLSGALRRLIEDMAQPAPDLDPIAQNDLGDMWFKLWGGR